jgi:hypothetical protein
VLFFGGIEIVAMHLLPHTIPTPCVTHFGQKCFVSKVMRRQIQGYHHRKVGAVLAPTIDPLCDILPPGGNAANFALVQNTTGS